MAKILIVHGIGNQYKGEMELRAQWHPALCDGLNRVGHQPLPQPGDCVCPFYGDLFRPGAWLGNQTLVSTADASEEEMQLLEAIWRSATLTDPAVPRPEDFKETLARAPRFVERALTSLAKSKFLAEHFPLRFLGDLKQVVLYLQDSAIRTQVLARIHAHLTPDTRVVIGHSLGSIVAYEAVCAKPANVTTLLTLGSPLGIRNVIFDKLTPAPGRNGFGIWPGHVETWTNVAASGDIVAAQKELAPLFGPRVDDALIDSGWEAHDSTRYLNTAQAGAALAKALSA